MEDILSDSKLSTDIKTEYIANVQGIQAWIRIDYSQFILPGNLSIILTNYLNDYHRSFSGMAFVPLGSSVLAYCQ